MWRRRIDQDKVPVSEIFNIVVEETDVYMCTSDMGPPVQSPVGGHNLWNPCSLWTYAVHGLISGCLVMKSSYQPRTAPNVQSGL